MDLGEHAEFLRSRTGGQSLVGQKALVTGVNSGIGKAVALAEAGAAVAANPIPSAASAFTATGSA